MTRVLEDAQLSQAELDLLAHHPTCVLTDDLLYVPDDMQEGFARLHRSWDAFIVKLRLEWMRLAAASFLIGLM